MQFYWIGRGSMAFVLRSASREHDWREFVETVVTQANTSCSNGNVERWRRDRRDALMRRHDSRDGWLRPVVANDPNAITAESGVNLCSRLADLRC